MQRILLTMENDGRVVSAHTLSTSDCKLDTGFMRHLSPAHVRILPYLAAGMNNQQICEQAIIARSTVRSHTSDIFGITGTPNRTVMAILSLLTNTVTADQILTIWRDAYPWLFSD